jgi:hypothetical protein
VERVRGVVEGVSALRFGERDWDEETEVWERGSLMEGVEFIVLEFLDD